MGGETGLYKRGKTDGSKDGKAQRTGEKELAETQMEGSGVVI